MKGDAIFEELKEMVWKQQEIENPVYNQFKYDCLSESGDHID
jgi:hypothetical protein